MFSLLVSGADQLLQHGQDILDSLAEIKPSVLGNWEKWQVNPSCAHEQSAPAPVSNMPPQHLVKRSNIRSHGASIPTNTRASGSQVSSNDVHTYLRTRTNDFLELLKSRELPDVANVPFTTLAGALVTVALPFNDTYPLSPYF